MPETSLQLLGRFQVRAGGAEVPPAAFGGRKVRTLLRLLAVRAPALVPHDVLADALWPARLPADPAANLGVLVNRARRAVGDPGIVLTGPGGYALGPCSLDIARLQDGLDRARAAGADHTAALRAATDALATWGEPLAEDTYADWAREARSRLTAVRVELLDRAAHAALELGDPRSAAAWAADAVAAEPLREATVLVLARARAAAGDPAGALDALAGLRRRLADELGVDPSPIVEELQVALLRGEVRTTIRPATAAPRPGSAFGELPFVGRDAELTRMHAELDRGGVVTVAGTAGSGKSRLLAELTRGTAQPVLAARAFLPERAEAWGLARSVLREALAVDAALGQTLPERPRAALADLLPELGTGPTAVLDGESRRALLLAGGLRVLEAATGTGALLVVDDVQWADPSSLVLISSALARLPSLTAVLAFRPEEVPDPVATILRELRPGIRIELGPLDEPALVALAGDAALAGALATGTDRSPFAVAEVLRELAARDVAHPTADGWSLRRADAADLAHKLGAAGQRAAVAERARRQTGSRADVLAVVALLAREAPAGTVAAATGLDVREALAALSGLAAAGLVRLGEQGWAAAHDLVGETVTAGLSVADRGRWHALLARALDDESAEPAEVARHHRDAGDTAAAAGAFVDAAGRALAGHGTREAAALAAAGLALDPRPAQRADLLAVRAEATAAHGDAGAAADDLRAALTGTGPGPTRARRLARLAMLTSGARDLTAAAELAELAIVEAGDDAPARAVALETAAVLDVNLELPERAADRAGTALELYRALGDARGVARILDGRAMATFLDGRITEAVETFGRVAQLFDDSGEPLRAVTPRSTRGHGLVFADRAADGLTETTAAVALARELDTAEGQAYALWHRSEALSALGRTAEATAEATEALAIATGIDHRGWTATAHRALGIAAQARGDLDVAAAAFAASRRAAGAALTLFASWADARSALVAVASGRLDAAAAHVRDALGTGPPLGHYEARLAEVALLRVLDDPGAEPRAAAALKLAREGGHLASARELAAILGSPAGRAGR